MIVVDKNRVVSIRYIMKNSEGAMLENSMKAQPVSYLHGAAGILLLLQEQLKGLKTGDKKVVYLRAETGLTSEDFVFDVIIDGVRIALDEEILLGYPVQDNVIACEENCECYDWKQNADLTT
jgi:FKBP-type peptidyl-prolyl cis-trans isomerase SlyD